MWHYFRVVLSVLCVLLTACSTTNYQQPVSQFAKGATDIKSAFNLIATERNTVVVNNMALSLQQKGTAMSPPENCLPTTIVTIDDASSTECAWTILYPRGKSLVAKIKHPETQALAFVGALDGYAQGLNEIATAKDVEELKAAVAKAGAAISNVASVVAPLAPMAYPVVKGITEGSAWLFGKFADTERLAVLTDIVEKAEPVLQQAIPALQVSANRLRSEILENKKSLINREMAEVTKLTVTHGDWSDSKVASRTVIKDALSYDKTAYNRMSDALGKMQSAHTSLLNSLKNPNVSFDDAIKTTSQFALEATTLIEIEKGK